jgi:hypothetical protein
MWAAKKAVEEIGVRTPISVKLDAFWCLKVSLGAGYIFLASALIESSNFGQQPSVPSSTGQLGRGRAST